MKINLRWVKGTAALAMLVLTMAGSRLYAEESLAEKVSDTAKEAWSATKETAKEVGNTLEKKVDELRADESPAKHNGNKVEVALKDSQITLPAAIPAGPTTFVVTNENQERRSFAIAGRKGDEDRVKSLAPGETVLITLDLPVGNYEVKSSIAGSDQETKRSLVVK